MRETVSSSEILDPERKRQYFIRLVRGLEEAVEVQKMFGLWEKKMITDPEKRAKFLKTKERIHQAPEHMFVVTARVQILAEWLGLSEAATKKLMMAAALHDAYKAIERAITEPLEYTYQSFRIAEAAENASLREAGVPDELITLQNAGGHDWSTATALTEQDDMMDEGWAWLVLYVVDMYSRGIDPAVSIRQRLTVDRETYTLFDETAKPYTPNGESGFDAMERTGNAALEKIAREISRRRGETIAPEDLPRLVDEELQRRIAGISLDLLRKYSNAPLPSPR